MSSDTVLKDKEGKAYSYDNLRTQGYLDGQSVGLSDGVKFLQEKAVELFRLGKHDAAITMQNLAKEMLEAVSPRLIHAAQKHVQQHPIEILVDESGWSERDE